MLPQPNGQIVVASRPASAVAQGGELRGGGVGRKRGRKADELTGVFRRKGGGGSDSATSNAVELHRSSGNLRITLWEPTLLTRYTFDGRILASGGDKAVNPDRIVACAACRGDPRSSQRLGLKGSLRSTLRSPTGTTDYEIRGAMMVLATTSS